ncbi:hypothetical protein A1D22_09380 [Pasteurellaceae bacterium LFhippo2]|nr:hypothetical protein [Pasteurellaceae bacterium LFhippo2]
MEKQKSTTYQKFDGKFSLWIEKYGYKKALKLLKDSSFTNRELVVAEVILKLTCTRGYDYVQAMLEDERAKLAWLKAKSAQKRNRNL